MTVGNGLEFELQLLAGLRLHAALVTIVGHAVE